MAWCLHCSGDRSTAAAAQLIHSPDGKNKIRRFTSCSACGRILKDRPLRSLNAHKALSTIHDMATSTLNLTADESSIITSDAYDLFLRALEKDVLFTRGRRAMAYVAAACLYVALRPRRKPFMLIDFSDYLRVTVFVLAAVLVALSRTLRLKEDGNSFTDPSLFMHRISTRLLGRNDAEVAATALRILSRWKNQPRDWMLSGQENIPIGLCSAALYIAAGHKFSKWEVVRAVRAEFESTEPGGGLTVGEFTSRAAELGSDLPSEAQSEELVCPHKNGGGALFCYGLCKECYDVFLEISEGGVVEQSAKRLKIKHDQGLVKSECDLSDCAEDYDINVCLNTDREKQFKALIWELMNKEYLEEQAFKSASTRTNIDGNKPCKGRKQKRAGGIGSKGTTADAKKETMKNTRLSSRINYDVLSQLYEEKGQRTETDTGAVTDKQSNENEENYEEFDEGMESYNEEDTCGENKSAEADYVGDFGEDYGEGEYNEYSAECNEEYADDGFGF